MERWWRLASRQAMPRVRDTGHPRRAVAGAVVTALVAATLATLAGAAQALPAVDDRSERALRRAGPFDAALRRGRLAPLPGSPMASRPAGPLALARADDRSATPPDTRPATAAAAGWAAAALADADPLADGAADPLERLLRAHALELAETPDAPGDPSGLGASAAALRSIAPGSAPTDPAAARARARALEQAAPTAVRIPGDGRRALAAHLFAPAGPGPHPAVLMLPAETGAHAGAGTSRCLDAGSQADGVCSARTLAQRYLAWGRWWASQGVTALLLDTARAGLPEALRAARWLRERDGIDRERLVLQGWGRSGRAVIAAALEGPVGTGEQPAFRSGLALWPDCPASDPRAGASPAVGPATAPRAGFELLVLIGAREGESVVDRCAAWLEPAARAGGGIDIVVFDDAGKGFDDPAARPTAASRNDWRANRFAMQDAMRRAATFVGRRTAASGTAPAPALPAAGTDRRD